MKRFVRSVCCAMFIAAFSAGESHGNAALQSAAQIQLPRLEFPLWTGDAPGALGREAKDIPTLTPYFAPPARATGAAFVICPGGGYAGLAPHEGVHYALWLNEQGIAGFVLKYRLGSGGYKHPATTQERAAGFALCCRANAEKWGLNPNKIGVMGSSAGGHLAATALTHFDAGDPGAADPIDRVSSRPDLWHSLLSGNHYGSGHTRRLEAQPPWGQPGSGPGRAAFKRKAGQKRHAVRFYLPYF